MGLTLNRMPCDFTSSDTLTDMDEPAGEVEAAFNQDDAFRRRLGPRAMKLCGWLRQVHEVDVDTPRPQCRRGSCCAW